MRYAALLVALLACACDAQDKDTPAVAARKAECKKLLAHIFEISPDTAGRSVAELVDGVPVEDVEQCGASRPKVVACMERAADIDGVHACVPVTVECTGEKPTRVTESNRPIYELAGDCQKVEIASSRVLIVGKSADALVVTGSDNTIEIDALKSIKASGAHNHILWKTGKDLPVPSVNDLGTKNTLTGVPADESN